MKQNKYIFSPLALYDRSPVCRNMILRIIRSYSHVLPRNAKQVLLRDVMSRVGVCETINTSEAICLITSEAQLIHSSKIPCAKTQMRNWSPRKADVSTFSSSYSYLQSGCLDVTVAQVYSNRGSKRLRG